MTDHQRGNIRVSDTEREDALTKLGQHMTEGRLDIEEYGERTAKVTAAKTRGEVLDLFGDLPEPRPTFGRPAPPPMPPSMSRSPRTVSVAQRVAPVLIPVAAVMLAVGLTFALRMPLIFLLPFIFFFANSGRWRHGPYRR